jgi:hypothetical protein
MTGKEIPNESSIEEKISWAQNCHRERGTDLLRDGAVETLLKKLQEAIHDSHREMAHAGIMEVCRLCEQEGGGSCCGLGMENKYTGIILLINLLLGHSIPSRRYDPSGCFFLGKEGCRLLARQVICINYLCKEITDRVNPRNIIPLREKEGIEVGLLFQLNELIKKKLRKDKTTKLNGVPEKTLSAVARFYDRRKVGDVGSLGFRRSTDLFRLLACLDPLIEKGVLVPGKSVFLDMGCADGRVNVLFSYLTKKSIGIELDEWTLEEYLPHKSLLEAKLERNHLLLPPDNIFLFRGNAMESSLYESVHKEAGIDFEGIDIFYTYLSMQEEFAGLIADRARKGAVFMVYGLEKIIPKHAGLSLLTPQSPLKGALALYQKA